MLLLADENFPKPIVELLRADGHDVLWAKTDCSGLPDLALLDRAEAEGRLVLTLDRDFWQIAMQRKEPPACPAFCCFRVHPATPDDLMPLVRRFAAEQRNRAGSYRWLRETESRLCPQPVAGPGSALASLVFPRQRLVARASSVWQALTCPC
jgi:predicted nuclease of predicted toxin-antitoxin system